MPLRMGIENLETNQNSSYWRMAWNKLLSAALWVALVAWVSSCGSWKWNEKDEEPQQTQYVQPVQDNSETTVQIENVEEHKWRTVVKTEKYVDEYGRTMTKNIYEDGSWSTSLEWKEPRYDYTEYYPNGNKKFEFTEAPYEWSYYAIYNQDGKLLYRKCIWWIREIDSASANEDKYFKYDEKGRLIEDHVHNFKYEYNDTEKKVIVTSNEYSSTAKHVVTYKMDDSGNVDFDSILSDKFIGETGAEIDLRKWWLDNLIRNMGMENIPHVRDY